MVCAQPGGRAGLHVVAIETAMRALRGGRGAPEARPWVGVVRTQWWEGSTRPPSPALSIALQIVLWCGDYIKCAYMGTWVCDPSLTDFFENVDNLQSQKHVLN